MRVPEDLSIIGFNDEPEAQEAELTTVRQPLVDKGLLAGRLIFDGNADEDVTVELDAQLVVRATTGAARAL